MPRRATMLATALALLLTGAGFIAFVMMRLALVGVS
jgi:hypothetical protein